jgi:hypothetical protein
VVNVIDEIFSQLDNSGLLDIPIGEEENEKLSFLKDLSLRVAIFDSCIFSYVVNDKDNPNEASLWYNIFHFNPASQEIIESEEKTTQFFNKFGIKAPKTNGLSYELVNLGAQASSSNNFEYEVNELVKSFEQKADCRFFIWFQDFYDNINLENQNILVTKLAAILKEYSKYSPAVLELILSEDPSTAASVAVSVFSVREDFILREDTITILENHLSKFDLTKESPLVKDYLKILIDNIVYAHTANSSHTKFLSQIITKEALNPKFTKDIIDRFELFLKSEDFKIGLFPEEVFKNFEILISTSQDKDPLLALLGQAVIKNYYKISLDTFSNFEKLFNSKSYLKDLAFEVICSYLHDEFAATNPNYAFLESKITHLFKSSYKLPKYLIKDVMNAYVQNQNYFFLNLLDIVEQYYNKTNNLLVEFGINLVDLIKIKKEEIAENAKNQFINKKPTYTHLDELSDKDKELLRNVVLTDISELVDLIDISEIHQMGEIFFTSTICEDQTMASLCSVLGQSNSYILINKATKTIFVYNEHDYQHYQSAQLEIQKQAEDLDKYDILRATIFKLFPYFMIITTDLAEIAKRIPNVNEALSNNLDVIKQKLLTEPIPINLDLLHYVNISNIADLKDVFQMIIQYKFNGLALIILPCHNEDENKLCKNLSKSTSYILFDSEAKEIISIYIEYEHQSFDHTDEKLSYDHMQQIILQEAVKSVIGSIDSLSKFKVMTTNLTEINGYITNNIPVKFADAIKIFASNRKAKLNQSENIVNDATNIAKDLSSQHIKDISFLLLRMAQAKVKLPEDALSSIAGFLNNNDTYIKRVIQKLYHKLDASFDLEANNFDYLKIPESFDIEAFAKFSKINEIERQLELIKTKNNFKIEHIAFILSYLREDNQEDFYWAIERIANYGLSTEIFDRDGDSVLDVFLKHKDASNWSKAIKRIYDDNNFFIDYDLGELLDKLKELNIKQNNPEILKLLEKDELDQNYFEKTFDQIKKIEDTWVYNFALCYDKLDISDQENTIYIYLESEQLFFKINNNITQITEDNDNTRSITNSILNKQTLKQDDIFYLSEKFGYYKDLKSWQKEDFIAWRGGIDEVNDNNIAQVLAVLKQAAFSSVFEHKYYPRMTQIITVLCMYKAGHGILAQVTTGEGKSVIIDLFAALKVLAKHKVDIVNSSKELAKRDAKEQKDFYDILGMTSGHNIVNTSGKKECYSYDVTYGDLGNYIGDDLRDIEFGTRAGRGYDIVIIDEVDNLLIDLKSMTVRLTSTTPGFFYLKEILAYLWSVYPNALSIGAEKCHASELGSDLTKCVEFLRETFTEFAKNNLLDFSVKRNESAITIPNQLTKFSKDQLPNWIESLLDALTKYSKDIHYTVHGDITKESYSNVTSLARVAPVDFDNTGTVNANMQWSNGLHQFLSLEERTFLSSENLVGLFMTYVAYISKFKGNIYGLTGTLGIKTHTDFLSQFYNVEFVTVPTFKEKKLVIYPEIIVNTQEEWSSLIVENTKARAIKDSRPVLVIMKTIKQVEELYKVLSEDESFKDFKIIQYVYGTEKERERIEEEEIENNTIIIATNLSGRGTDIKIDKLLEKNGGLHVILTYFPDSIRVLMQGFGRAARKGEFGSAQLIIINELSSNCDDMTCLEGLRDERELAKFKEEGTCRLPHIMMQDWLFGKFHEVFSNLNLPTGYKIVTDNNIDPETTTLVKDHLYLSLDNAGIYLSGLDDNGIYFSLKIDEELVQYDPDLTNHIRAILKANQASISLNKQDLELVHFIAAKHGLNLTKDDIMSKIQEMLGIWQQKCLNQIKNFNNIRNTVNTENTQNKEISIFELKDKCDLEVLLSKDLVTYLKAHLPNDKAGELTQAELDYFLYALWKKYLETYNKNPDIAQVKALWEMWLYYQNELFEQFIYECDEHNSKQAIILEAELREKLAKSFEVFATQIREKYSELSLFDNPKLLLDKAYLYSDIYHSPFHQFTKEDPVNDGGGDLVIVIRSLVDDPNHLLSKALKFTNIGIDLDDPLAFALYQARAIIRLIKSIEENIRYINADDVARAYFFKQQTYKDFNEVLTRIRQTSAQQESVIMALAMMGLVEPGQDLMNQYVIQRELFSLMDESVVNATKLIESARYDQKIALNGVLTLQDLAKRINITESYNKTLSSLSGLTNNTGNSTNISNSTDNSNNSTGNSTNPYVARLLNTTTLNQNLAFAKESELIRVATSEMVATFGFTPVSLVLIDLEEEEQDWTGTIFSAIAGIAQIFASFAVIAIGGPFAASFGLSMLMSGISDVLASVISVIEDRPIDLEQYFKAKALTYAIAIITAGIAQIGKVEFKGFNSQGEKVLLSNMNNHEMFAHALKLTVASTIVGYGVSYAANKIIDSNDGDLEKEANEAARWLVHHYQNELQQIFIADELNTEEDIFYELARSVSYAARGCMGRFNDMPSNLAQSTFASAASLGGSMWGAVAAGIAGAAIGLIKYNEFAGEFKDEYGFIIISEANKARRYLGRDGSSKIMYKTLAKTWHLSQSNIAMDELVQAGFVDQNNNIDYSKCSNIGTYEASLFNAIDQTSLIKVCNEIYQDYLNYRNSLENTIAQNLKAAMSHTLKQDVAKPILMQAGYYLYDKFTGWFDNLKNKDTKEKEEASSSKDTSETANDNNNGDGKDNKNTKNGKESKDPKGKKPILKLVQEQQEPEVIISDAKNHANSKKETKIEPPIDPRIRTILEENGIPLEGLLTEEQYNKMIDLTMGRPADDIMPGDSLLELTISENLAEFYGDQAVGGGAGWTLVKVGKYLYKFKVVSKVVDGIGTGTIKTVSYLDAKTGGKLSYGLNKAEGYYSKIVDKADDLGNWFIGKKTVKIGSDAGSGFKHFWKADTKLFESNMIFDSRKIQGKYKHAQKAFGIEENYNKANAELFESKIIEHINSQDVIKIAGTYQKKIEVIHYYDPKTMVNIMKTKNGEFHSGWKLGEKQEFHLKINGNIGGNRK